MHILYIPSWYSTPTNAIRGANFRQQAVMMQRLGHRVGMLVPPARLRTRHGLRETVANWRRRDTAVTVQDDAGIITYRIPWWGWRGLASITQRGKLALDLFDRYCAEQGTPDVLHGRSALYGGFMAAWIGHHRKLPVVFTEHASWIVQGPIFPGQPGVIRYTLEHSDRILSSGVTLVDALQRFAPGVHVEPFGNAVDTDFFTFAPTPPQPPFTFTLVGNLYTVKRVDVLLTAFAQAFKGAPLRLNIVGDGIERAVLVKQCQRLELTSQVHFLGAQSHKAVRQHIHESHAIVSSSHVETFGISLIEAMSCGRPVVATCSGGPEWFVNEHNGILVERDNPSALADGLRHMVEMYSNYDSVQIREEIVERFSLDAVARRQEAIYHEVIDANKNK